MKVIQYKLKEFVIKSNLQYTHFNELIKNEIISTKLLIFNISKRYFKTVRFSHNKKTKTMSDSAQILAHLL